MKKIISLPLFFIFLSFLYSVTHLSDINQITLITFLDVLQLFYAIFFWVFLFGIAIHYGFFQYLGKIFYPILHPLLHLNQTEIAVYIASMFSGYPSFAKVMKDAHLTQESILHLLRFCSHPSIGFVVITLGLTLFQDIVYGYFLFAIQLISNFIIAFLSRGKEHYEYPTYNDEKLPFIQLIKKQLKATFEIFIYIFGFMLVFRIIGHALPFNHIIISGVLEFSQGCLQLTNLPNQTAFILCSFFLSFSSLSVICQTLSILDYSISFKSYFFYRLTQGITSGFLAFFTSLFIF